MKPAVLLSVLSVAVLSVFGLVRHHQPQPTPAPDTAEQESPEEPILFVG